MVFFFFQKKKQKALFRFADSLATHISAKPTLGVWGLAPRNRISNESISLTVFFFFQKKKQKALFCFAEGWLILKELSTIVTQVEILKIT
jgi:hypothetical protein